MLCMHAQSLSRVRLFATSWTVARQAPLSVGFSRQEYCGGFLAFSRGSSLTQGLNPGLLHCRQIIYQLSYQGSLKEAEKVSKATEKI